MPSSSAGATHFCAASPPSSSSSSRGLFRSADDDDCLPRASFQGGPPPGAFMLGPAPLSPQPPSSPSHPHPHHHPPFHGDASPQREDQAGLLPYGPSDYDAPQSLAASPPVNTAALTQARFSWASPHPYIQSYPQSHTPRRHNHNHNHLQHPHQHHYQYPQHPRFNSRYHWPPEPVLAAGGLHPSLSQSSHASHDSRSSQNSSAITEFPSEAASSDLPELTLDAFDNVVDSMDTQTFTKSGNKFFAELDSDACVKRSDTGSRTTRTSHNSRRGTPGLGSSTNDNWLSKLHTYANSRLPPDLPPLRLYIPTWPLLCLAAQYARRAYSKPDAAERETHVEADARDCPKAMVIRSVALDHMNLVVFALRGSTLSFRDWATNMDTEPASPRGFLDDAGNFCHAGFLAVARQMVKPVALRLRQLLEEDPNRGSCSLIITGHSAGGAVASLLYAHMLSQTIESELIDLRNRFKRVHCVSFGAPPLSLLPLDKPSDARFDKWLFFSFVNEGDPVVRAERAYVRSLMELYNSAAPDETAGNRGLPAKLGFRSTSHSSDYRHNNASKSSKSAAVWKLPAPTLALAGRLILLRTSGDSKSKLKDGDKGKNKGKGKERIEALLTSNEDLVHVVFGDLLMHPMKQYERRVQVLATDAVTAKFAE